MTISTAFRTELDAASDNHSVGTSVWFENDRVRIWEIRLQPGERVPFHHHVADYFWVCVEPGRGLQRAPDGTEQVFDFALGEVDFLEMKGEHPLIHDLENVGDTLLRFVTVELKDAPTDTK